MNVGRISQFTSAANTVAQGSQRIRTALAGTSKSVGMLHQNMSMPFRARLFGNALQTISRTNDELSRLRATFMALSAITGTGLTTALAGTYLLQTADRARLLQNQLRTVTDSHEELYAVQTKLFQLAQSTRSSMASTVTIYARTARATETLGISQEKLLRITGTIQKAFSVGGATQAEASGAAIQLSQGIASDRFSGEEFRSVAENAPVLLKGMADALGVNIGKLREMAHAGELTAQTVVTAILGSANQIDAAFNTTTATVGQAMTRLDNAFLQYIGNADRSLGITRRLSELISGLAENFDAVASVAAPILGIGLAGVGGRILSGVVAAPINAVSNTMAQRRSELDLLRQQTLQLANQRLSTEANLGLLTKKNQLLTSQIASQSAGSRQIIALQTTQLELQQKINEATAQRTEIMVAQAAVGKQQAAAQAKVNTGVFGAIGSAAAGIGGSILGAAGGWMGVLFTAVIIGFFQISEQGAKAAERTRRVTESLKTLGIVSEETADALEGAGKSLEALARDEIVLQIKDVKDELATITTQQDLLGRIFYQNANNFGNLQTRILQVRDATDAHAESTRNAADQLLQLFFRLTLGAETADTFREKFEQISATVTDMSDVAMARLLKDMRDTILRFKTLTQAVDALNDSLRDVVTDPYKGLFDFFDRPVDNSTQNISQAIQLRRVFIPEQFRQAGLSSDEDEIQTRMKKLSEDMASAGAGTLPQAELRDLAVQLIAYERHVSDAAQATKDAADAAEKYADGIQKLKMQAMAEPLSEFDKGVLSTAESLGATTEELEAFIAAATSGDMDSIPGRIRAISDIMREIATSDALKTLKDEMDSLFRTPVEQRIHETLSSLGLDAGSEQGKIIDGQIRFIENMKTAQEISKEFWGGMVSDLKEGVSFTDALGNAFTRLKDRLLDMALDLAINAFLSMLTNQISGGTGPLSSIFKMLIPHMASGTNYAPGGLAWTGEEGPELISLPRGSKVFSHSDSMGMMGGGTVVVQPKVVVNNYAKADVTTRTNANGDLELTVRGVVRDELAGQNTSGMFKQQFGLQRSVKARG